MSTHDSKVFKKRIHVFTAGPQISAQGVERNFSPKELKEVQDTYDPNTHEAPLVIGHSGDNDGVPSYGWIENVVCKGDKLYADVDFTDVAKDLVDKGHYKKVSISFYSPNSPINPHPGKWSVRHLALLGASPPAVKGLESFSFKEREGIFDFTTALTPDQLFDPELGPTLLVEKSPLEMLKERFETLKKDMSSELEDLEQNQNSQTETDVAEPTAEDTADQSTAPENPNQQFSEMKKKMGREGAEVSESAQSLANMETQLPEEEFEEGRTSRKVSDGAHGQKVQVVEQVFEEKELPESFKKNMAKMKMKAKAKQHDVEDEEMEEDEEEFAEVPVKKASKGKATFGTHPQHDQDDPSLRGQTGRSDTDSYGSRQAVGKGPEEERDTESSDSEQDMDRVRTAKDSGQDDSRATIGKAPSDEANGESRWADQPESKSQVMNADQFDDGEGDLPERNRPGVSDGTDPRGRDDGPTEFPEKVEEEPDTEDITVPLESTKGNKKVRVLHQRSGQKRAELVGGDIADHSEESDGVTKKARKAGISDGTDPHGRDGGPTEFPERSEEEPDDLEMAVDLESVVDNPKVRVVRQKSGDEASISYMEDDDMDDEEEYEEDELPGKKLHKKFSELKSPMTKTGKGSTYGQRDMEFEDEEDEEDEDFSETEDFCGMGSMGQSKAMGYPTQMYEEFRKELDMLKSENERLKKEYQEHQVRTRKQKIADFVDSLYVEGKMTDGIIPQRELQHYCEGLEFGTLEFSEGETPTTKLFDLLNRLPNLVHFGEVVAEGRYDEPDEYDLDPHSRALKMIETGECSDYVEAIKRCIPWGGKG